MNPFSLIPYKPAPYSGKLNRETSERKRFKTPGKQIALKDPCSILNSNYFNEIQFLKTSRPPPWTSIKPHPPEENLTIIGGNPTLQSSM